MSIEFARRVKDLEARVAALEAKLAKAEAEKRPTLRLPKKDI